MPLLKFSQFIRFYSFYKFFTLYREKEVESNLLDDIVKKFLY